MPDRMPRQALEDNKDLMEIWARQNVYQEMRGLVWNIWMGSLRRNPYDGVAAKYF